jgi:hypothetical protein
MQRRADLRPRQGGRANVGPGGAGRGPRAARGRGGPILVPGRGGGPAAARGRGGRQAVVAQPPVAGGPPGVPIVPQPILPPPGQVPLPRAIQAASCHFSSCWIRPTNGITTGAASRDRSGRTTSDPTDTSTGSSSASTSYSTSWIRTTSYSTSWIRTTSYSTRLGQPVIPPVGLGQPVIPPV